MDRTTRYLTIIPLLLLAACPSTNNNVGTIAADGGGTGATGCVRNGVTYAIGESFEVDCNRCTCGLSPDLSISCTTMACRDDAGAPLTPEQSCLQSPPVLVACDSWTKPTATVNSAPGGPLLSKVEVTSGACDVVAAPDCSAGCTSITVSSSVASQTCELLVTSTDGRSQSAHFALAIDPSGFLACCPNGLGGNVFLSMPPTLSPSSITVEFSSDGGMPIADGSGGINLGTPCDILTDAGPSQAVFNSQALECSSRICLKPTVDPAAGTVDTGAFCSASCLTDADCGGQLRDPNNPNDTKCRSGYTCGIPFPKGPLCCQQLCLCRDFLGSNGAVTPIACLGGGAATCN